MANRINRHRYRRHVTTRKREITPRVLKRRKRTRSYVVLCTGRPYPGAELLQELDLVNDHDYVVTYNGTWCNKQVF